VTSSASIDVAPSAAPRRTPIASPSVGSGTVATPFSPVSATRSPPTVTAASETDVPSISAATRTVPS